MLPSNTRVFVGSFVFLGVVVHKNPTLLALRSSIARAERDARRQPAPAAPAKVGAAPKPLKAQREADLEGIDTRDFVLTRAHQKLRDLVFDARYDVRPHAIGHARAEGFLEHDIVAVLVSGRVRAVYPQDRRLLVCGYFEAHGYTLPLHVVVELGEQNDWLDVVTAFVPKHPHHVVSRARLALMLRWDQEQVRSRVASPGNKVGHKSKGRWKRGA